MKETIQHEKYGLIEFSEGLMVGNRTITVNGQALQRKSNKQFYFEDGTSVQVVGGLFSGINLSINDDVISITPPGKWYEIALYIAGLVLMIIWSNSYALCSFIPMIGGALGGMLYAIPAVLGLSFSIRQKSPMLKLTITACTVLLGLIFCMIGAVIYLALA